MPSAMKSQDSSYVDYIGNYERVMRDVVVACGGREQANRMLGEMREEYEKMNVELKRLRRQHSKNAEKFATEKVRLLSAAQNDVTQIIQKYAPGSADRVRELVFGTSLAMSAMLVPVTYAVSALSVATSIVSVGSNYRRMVGKPSPPASESAFASQMRRQKAEPSGFTGRSMAPVSKFMKKKS